LQLGVAVAVAANAKPFPQTESDKQTNNRRRITLRTGQRMGMIPGEYDYMTALAGP